MPYRPLISKIRVHNPNMKKSVFANREYVKYIATREGVALDSVEETEDAKMHYGATDKDYLKYIADRPRSHGLFGNIDTDDLSQVQKLIANETESGKIIYRGIISLSEEDGAALGFTNPNEWNLYLKRTIPEISKMLGISSVNNTWVAAFHAEQTHPHVHYMLWENDDHVRSSFIHKSTQKKIRNYLEKEMFDNEYEKSIKQVFEKELSELKETRNIERSNLMASTEKIMMAMEYVPGLQTTKLPIRPSNEYLQKLTDQMGKLVSVLPEHGRLNYKFLPGEAKEQLNKIVDTLLEKPEMEKSIKQYLDAVEQTNEFYGKTKTDIDYERKKAEADIRKRIANRVLKSVKNVILDEKNMAKEEEKYNKEKMRESGFNPSEKEMRGTGFPSSGKDTEDTGFSPFATYIGNNMYVPFDEIEKGYHMEWSITYKVAMDSIYGEEPNLESAFEMLEHDAMQGNALSIYETAKLIERFELNGVEKNEALEYYKEAFDAFNEIYKSSDSDYKKNYAAYKIGKMYSMGQVEENIPDYDKAASWYEKSENSYAKYSLGMLYLSNKIDIDDEERYVIGRELLEEAEPEKIPFAAYELGNIYSRGIGTEINVEKSQDYYKMAFEKFKVMVQNATDSNLIYRLGTMYLNGLGTEINSEEGEKFIKKAAELGNDTAKYKLAMIYLMKDDDLLKEKAITSLEELAKNENVMAKYALGTIYMNEELPEHYNIEKAVKYLEESAEQGNQFAQYRLGSIYMNEELPEHYDIEKAVKYLEESAEQGNQFAQYRLGTIYMNEELPEHYNIEKAVKYLEESAEQGNQFAQYRLGSIYMKEELPEHYDIEKAVKYLEESAEQGNQFAQYRLGTIYMNEELPEHYNIEKAVKYLEEPAEQGNQFAQYRLGSIYMNEELPEHCDIEKAVKYLEEAAEQGNQFAQYRLGTIYMKEELPEHYNIEKAVKYLEESAEQGNQFAQYRLGSIYMNEELPEHCDIEKAVKYTEKAAEQGNQFAQYRLGSIYMNRELPEYYDIEKAVKYLEEAATQGNQFAQYRLGTIYMDGEKPDYYNLEKAVKYLEEAATQGNQFAQYRLGTIFSDKNYIHFNMQRSIDYFTLSAEQGNMYAQCRLGCIYYFGKDTFQDKEVGAYWLNKAAEQGEEFAKRILDGQMFGINFSYCLLKGVLSSVETLNRSISYDHAQMNRTNSRQAMREKALHHDLSSDQEY